MSKREAERFEEALQEVSGSEVIDNRLALLLHTARQAAILAEPPPAPPRGLAPGRQRFLAEAARRRAERAERQRQRLPMARMAKLAAAFAAVILLFGVMFGTGKAAAGSLPGHSFYGLKLAGERVQLALTRDLQAKADLNLALAAERLDEIVGLLEQGQAPAHPVVSRAEQQLTAALEAAIGLDDTAAVQELQQLSVTIQQRERTMQQLGDASAAPPVQELLREMERVHQEAQSGQDDPDGLRRRLRQGVPPDLTDLPDPSHTPQGTQTPGPRPTSTPHPKQTPRGTSMPGATPQPTQTLRRTAQPNVTPQPTNAPHTAQPSVTLHPAGTAQMTAQPSATPRRTGMPQQTSSPGATPGSANTPGPANTAGPANTPGPGGDPGHGGP